MGSGGGVGGGGVPALTIPPALLAAMGAAAAASPREAPARLAGEAGGVQLWASKVFAPDHLHVAFFVVGAVADAQVSLAAAPPHLSVALHGTGRSGAVAPGGAACACVATFALAAVPVAGALRGQLAFAAAAGGAGGAGAPQTLPFSLELPASDCLRAAPLDTPAFGAVWVQPAMAAEELVAVPAAAFGAAPARSADELLRRLAAAGLNLHGVQAIAATGEAIAAARVMALPTTFCLVHLTLQPGGGVQARVRSAERAFSAAVGQAIAARLR
jgi:hypothetical protein